MSTPPLAVSHPDAFAPQIVPLDLSTDALADFASEAPVAPARTTAPLPVVTRGPIVLRVPRWVAVTMLSTATASLGSLLTLTLVDRSPAGTTAPVAVVQTRGFVEAPAMARPVLPVPARWESPASSSATAEAGSASGARSEPVRAERTRTVSAPQERARPGARPTETSRPAPAAAPPRPVPTGIITIASAFPVQVLEDGAVLGDSRSRVTLPAGTHVLTLVNDALEYRETQTVTVEPRKALALSVEVPRGTLHVNARPWADVWIDGRRAGETPLGNLSLPIGTHEVVLRHPQLGESRHTVTVGARTPARLAVELLP